MRLGKRTMSVPTCSSGPRLRCISAASKTAVSANCEFAYYRRAADQALIVIARTAAGSLCHLRSRDLADGSLWRIAALGLVASNIRLLTKAEIGESLPGAQLGVSLWSMPRINY